MWKLIVAKEWVARQLGIRTKRAAATEEMKLTLTDFILSPYGLRVIEGESISDKWLDDDQIKIKNKVARYGYSVGLISGWQKES